nr:ABC transporter permease [Actinomycetota bacterium]
VGVLFVLPLVAQALPTSIADDVGRFLPAEIGAAMTTTVPDVHFAVGSFSPWAGFGLLCGYAVASLLIGGWLLERRDA